MNYGWSTATSTTDYIRKTLPAGTTRKIYKDKKYEEVIIPAKRLNKKDLTANLISIKDSFDPYTQLAFNQIKYLNLIQSKCFDAAYKRNENLLICAPTGAGKTNIAMSCIAREIYNHVEHNCLKNDDLFKIIYVAPMKALAQEVVYKFNQRLNILGIQVKELTGDQQLSKKEIKETHIIVTTPEKWDVITRKSGDGSLIDMVKY